MQTVLRLRYVRPANLLLRISLLFRGGRWSIFSNPGAIFPGESIPILTTEADVVSIHFRMTAEERLTAYATFLGINVRQLRDLAIKRGLGSETTFARICESGRQDRGKHCNSRALAKLAGLIDPMYFAAPYATDPIAWKQGQRMSYFGSEAQAMWRDFLGGATDDVPKWETIEARMSAVALGVDDRADVGGWGDMDGFCNYLMDFELRAFDAGVVGPIKGLPRGHLLRWAWTGSRAKSRMLHRLHAVFQGAQWLIERDAVSICFATPIISFSLLPLDVLHLSRFGHDADFPPAFIGHSGDDIPERKVSPVDGESDDEPTIEDWFPDGFELKSIWRQRQRSLEEAIISRRQVVCAIFCETRTQAFFEKLAPGARVACVRHLARLERSGLVLLGTQLDEEVQDHEVHLTLTSGGYWPGIALRDPLTCPTRKGHPSIVTFAHSREYRAGRALFDDIANSRCTRRVYAADLKALGS